MVTKAPKTAEERFRLLVEGVVDYASFMLDPRGAGRRSRRPPASPEPVSCRLELFTLSHRRATWAQEFAVLSRS